MKILIVAPRYSSGSAGVACLYQLASFLSLLKHAVHILNPTEASPILPFTTYDFVIIPEVYEKPRGKQNIVRWCLNEPGKLKNDWGRHCPNIYEPNELVLYWKGLLTEKIQCATRNPIYEFWLGVIDPDLFHKQNQKQFENCHWIGKGSDLYRNYSHLLPKDSIYLTKGMPQSEYAKILRKTKNYFTFDDFSASSGDAYLCGCNLFILKNGAWVPYKVADEDVTSYLFNESEEILRTNRMLDFVCDFFGLINDSPASKLDKSLFDRSQNHRRFDIRMLNALKSHSDQKMWSVYPPSRANLDELTDLVPLWLKDTENKEVAEKIFMKRAEMAKLLKSHSDEDLKSILSDSFLSNLLPV
jgi:hypothetical protein